MIRSIPVIMTCVAALLGAFPVAPAAVAAPVAPPAASSKPKVYGIATMSLEMTKAGQFPALLRAQRAALAKRGIDLVASYQVQFGEDITRQVNIWSANDAETIRTALAAPDPSMTELRKCLLSEIVQIASRNPIAPSTAQSGKSVTSSRDRVYALVNVTIDPSAHAQFVEQVKRETAIQGSQGVDFVASYHVEIGDRMQEIDIWAAPDAETIRRAFFSPDAASGTLDALIRKEGVEIAAPNIISDK